MKIYAYDDKKNIVAEIDAQSDSFQAEVLSALEEGTLREVIAESMFNDGHRKESAEISFVLVAMDFGAGGSMD